MRAYRHFEDYLSERVDVHKSSNTWPLLANQLPAEQIEAHVFVQMGGGLNESRVARVDQEAVLKDRALGSAESVLKNAGELTEKPKAKRRGRKKKVVERQGDLPYFETPKESELGTASVVFAEVCE
jgi:hypothetical protein